RGELAALCLLLPWVLSVAREGGACKEIRSLGFRLQGHFAGQEDRWPYPWPLIFRRQTAPRKYSYMLGGMVSLCSLAMCLRTISEYRKRSPQMRQCHWSWAKMYGRHSELFGSSLGSGILIIKSASVSNYNPKSAISVR